jgi:uncharacterized membrane protein
MSDVAIDTLYTQELRRVLAWRRSLDATRNLAVGIVAAMALVAFGFQESSHLVLFLGSLTVFALAIFESRMYQFAEVSEERLRDIEQKYFGPLLDPSLQPTAGWREALAKSLAAGGTGVSFIEAFAARVLRNYFLIFLALDACWFSKLYLYPNPAPGLSEFVHRADLGFVPGWLVLSVVVPVWGSYIALIVWLLGKYSGRERRY